MIARPKPGETEDDLKRLEAEFQQGDSQCSVKIKRPIKKATVVGGPDQKPSLNAVKNQREGSKRPNLAGRFTLDLDTLPELESYQVLFDVEERNTDLLDLQPTTSKLPASTLKSYSEDDGFPEAIDLSSYYKVGSAKRQADAGKSYFATEFDRLNGHIEDARHDPIEEDSITALASETQNDFEEENVKRLAAMKNDELVAARKEIEEKLDPKLLEFLKNRHKSKNAKPSSEALAKPQVSQYKQAKLLREQGLAEEKNEPQTSISTEAIRQLEVLEEFADWKAEEKYDRLAADAVQLDLLTKCARRVIPRQEHQATRLFDLLKASTRTEAPNSTLELARSKIDEIKKLYLEEINVGGKQVQRFANGLNPVVDGSWMLRPIRSVLDAMQKSERSSTTDDLDIVRLTLMWTALLFAERPTLFYTMVDPSDFYVRLAELYILGPELFTDTIIEECTSMLLEQFLLPQSRKGQLILRLERPVAGLDAFMPFYEELLTKYEEFSVGHIGFSKIILLGAYGNSALSDALECQLTLWSSRRNVVREMTTSSNVLKPLLDFIKEISENAAKAKEETCYVQYSMLLSEYAGALRSRRVEKERNSGAFMIAANELGAFVLRHTSAKENVELSTPSLKDFDSLVCVLREAVKDVLTI